MVARDAVWADRLAGVVVLRLTVQSQVRAGMSRARGWGVTGARLAQGNGWEYTHTHMVSGVPQAARPQLITPPPPWFQSLSCPPSPSLPQGPGSIDTSLSLVQRSHPASCPSRTPHSGEQDVPSWKHVLPRSDTGSGNPSSPWFPSSPSRAAGRGRGVPEAHVGLKSLKREA